MSKVIESLRSAVEHRERISLDDIDAANLLAEIERQSAELAALKVKQPCLHYPPSGYVLMPTTLTPEMCQVIRNEHDVYGSAEELYAALLHTSQGLHL